MPKFLSLTFLVLSFLFVSAQDTTPTSNYPQDYFSYPLKITPAIAGSFGELRSNHFHSGLDFRTNQREGYPVYAPADGFVSRLRIQIGGGGNHVYITHPNGYTTVYMHLQRFNEKITRVLKAYQARKEQFDVDFPLMSVEIPVKKGEIIAWSGNTGGSAGPHLHFEIRDTKTEETINAQLFGVTIPDRVKPNLSGLYMYDLNGKPFSENTPKHYFQVAGANGQYHLSQSPLIKVKGEIGFGIVSTDQNSASQNQNGDYSVELQLDNKTIYKAVWERFSFSNSKAVNSHIDYPTFVLTGRRIQKSFIEPGNPLGIYKEQVNNGVIHLTDDLVHDVHYVISDVAGNETILDFKIQNTGSEPNQKIAENITRFAYNQDNEYATGDIKISIPKGNLYDDLFFNYSVSKGPAGAYSAVHHVQSRLTPVHNFWNLWIKPDSTLPEALRSKALIVDQRGVSQGGYYEDGYIKAQPRVFGNFFVKTDAVPPTIVPINISQGKSLASASSLRLRISDNLSGISMFKGYIDDKWVLMEYEYKTGMVWHTFDENLSKGKHNFILEVTDGKNNKKTYSADFYR